ncbi:Bug family tripartite tricarboxylate transporter substrate binding protein [Aquabacter spiritensis]|uniref:Tripartite-type tricarboxylate transporter receptor subunit TctC n=1 Tax=Aquabacter spiritensis TaxID=933073 RepID=A0A4R3LLD9_9HYPH|nr:tripartite tricarboxylate transporter substrate binding protein [Aquabacter spiritensis]TCT01103.1 tripartite-type tricarboxylate transporter receptor subunit TctC [Aquabacter spiritensis]
MKILNTVAAIGLCVVALFALAPPIAAQTAYPSRAVRIIVPYPPGGGADAVGRLVAQGLSEQMHQPFVVENRGGAGTNIGLDATAKATPDGYTIGMATSNLAINPAIYPSIPFNAETDFAGITLLTKGLYVLVVHPSVPANTVEELIALAKAKPGTLNAAIAGLGTPGHLALAEFNKLTGVDLLPVPYQGAGPAMTSVLGNQTQVLFISMASAIANVKAGKLRLLAVTSATRSPELPDVPTAMEAGLKGLEIYEWYGLVAPAKMDPAQIDALYEKTKLVLAQPAVRQRIQALGAEPAPMPPKEFEAFIKAEIKRLGQIVRDTGIKVE